ncbi:MAG: hypothetical protein V3T05_02290 [Myxococcota bacterium]
MQARLTASVFVIASMTACSSAAQSSGYSSSYSMSVAPTPPRSVVSDQDLRAQSTVVVPPDRAVVSVRIEVVEGSFDDAATATRELIGDLVGAAQGVEGCAVTVDDYEAPLRLGTELYSASADLSATFALQGLPDVGARMKVVDACTAALQPHLTSRPRHGKMAASNSGRYAWAGPLRLEIADPGAHRAKLIERLSRRLASVENVSAPQWQAGDLRCTSTGLVRATERTLAGVRLELDVRCDIVRPKP